MKILLLRVENIKKIKVVEVKPDGTLNLVTGKNDQGKSTLIDAISYLFEGKRALPEKLLREGTKKGLITSMRKSELSLLFWYLLSIEFPLYGNSPDKCP